jgi:hypothetical protein
MKPVSGSSSSGRIPNFSPLRFGNGGTARKKFENAILKAGEFAYSIGDVKTKDMILSALVAISNIRSNDKNYQRWADLLNAQVANGFNQIWPCITTITREAQSS